MTRLPLAALLLLLCACPKTTTPDGACQADGDCTKPSVCCNGKCTNTLTSAANCGACGAACSTANGQAKCSLGQCAITCGTGFGDCNKDVKDGCEVDLSSTLAHCGKCRQVCEAENAAAVCQNSQCFRLSCNAGFGDCDGFTENGCETKTTITLNHCGACGKKCEVTEGTGACVDSACTVATCNADYGDCDKMAATGCETDLRVSDAHCSACGMACPTGYHCKMSKCQAPELVFYGGMLNLMSALATNQVSTFNIETHTWKGITTMGTDTPGNRAGHVAVWDAPANRMLVWGGFLSNNAPADTELYALDFTPATPTWSKLTVTGTPPATRTFPGVAWDKDARLLYLFGGGNASGSQMYAELWVLDVAKLEWSQRLEPNIPAGRSFLAMAWDTARQRIVMGLGQDVNSNNVPGFYAYDPKDGGTGWSAMQATGAPLPRSGAPFLGQAQPLTLYGGTDEFFDFFTDTFVLNPDGGDPDAGLDAFEMAVLPDNPGERTYVTATSTNDRRFLFGGFGFDTFGDFISYSDLWELTAVPDAGLNWVRVADGGVNFSHPGTVFASAVSRE